MPDPILIKFTKDQLKFCEKLAKDRHDSKNKSIRNKSYMKIEKGGDFYLPHKIGILGEFAYSIFSGVPIDKEIYKVRDSGVDFDGIEVKTITYTGKNPELKISIKEFENPKRKKPKKYILARFDKEKPSQVELLGEISFYRFNKYKKTKRYWNKTHENYVVGEKYLNPLSPNVK